MKLRVPYFAQNHDYSCGPAALAMVFSYYGLDKRQEDIIKEASFADDGSLRRKEMQKLAELYGFVVYVGVGAKVDDLIGCLDRGFPVIVDFIEPTNNEGHYAVLIGYEGDELIFNDPWNGPGFRMKKDEFVGRWRSGFESIEPWLMVVSTKGTKF